MEPQTARDVTAPSPVKKNNGIEFKEVKRKYLLTKKRHVNSRDVVWRPKTTWVKNGGRLKFWKLMLKEVRYLFILQVRVSCI